MTDPRLPRAHSSVRLRRGTGLKLVALSTALAAVVGAGVADEAVATPTTTVAVSQVRTAVRLVKPRIPGSRIYLGAWTDLPRLSLAASVALRQRQLGRRYRIIHHYYSWRDTFPNTTERREAATGQIPLISWNGVAYAAINNGSQDSVIRARALGLRRFGKPVFLRWAWEMNGNWFAWDGVHNGSRPANYVRAWRRVVTIFRSVGATNVAFVWSPNFESQPGLSNLRSWNNWRRYYPGNAYVDWVGIDGYNFGTWGWWSAQYLFGRIYNDYARYKPIMIAETSSTERGGIKASWISALGTWVGRHRRVKAVVWFDTRQSNDWRVDSSGRTFRAYRALARSRLFLG